MSNVRDHLSCCVLAAAALSLTLVTTNAAFAETGLPARPGQYQAPEIPTTQPHAQTQPAATSPAASSDEDFLNQTAGDLGEKPPATKLDQRILDWDGVRPVLESYGLTLQGTNTADFSKALNGGADTRANIGRNLLDLRLNLDTHALVGWKGGTFSLDLQNQVGRNGSDHVGDAQGFDNADADGRSQISELWYQQLLLGDRVRIKVGKVDANTEFAAPSYTSGFINSSWGYSPTITGLPTYPDGSTSVNVFIYPTRWFYAGVGVYDGGGRSQIETGSYGPSKLWHSGESYFTIGEAGVRWLLADSTLPGRLAVGGSYHSGNFGTFNGGTQNGAASEYLIAEQKIWHKYYYDKTNPAAVYLSLQYGHADRNVSPFTDHLGLAAVWVEPYAKANPDSLGLGATAVRFTDESSAGFTRNYETSIEAYYNFQVTSYFSIRPDFQYIVNPGGDRDLDNASVFTVRAVFNF